MQATNNVARELICAIIRGDTTASPWSDDISSEHLIDVAIQHEVHLILWDALKKLPTLRRLPLRLRQRLEALAATASAFDLIRERELRTVLTLLNRNSLRPILLKGVPFAYNLYPSPELRPRSDTDFLIRATDLGQVAHLLTDLGYSSPGIRAGTLASYQCQYQKTTAFGLSHILDVHWKINNAQVFANTLTFDEAWGHAIDIPSLAACARGLCHKHALLLACMHRFGHAHAPFYADGKTIYAGDHLLWVYDIDLLCSALSAAQWLEFAASARAKRIAVYCLDGLNAAQQAFRTQVPTAVMEGLEVAARNEAVNAARLRASPVAWFWANLRTLPDLREQLTLIHQVVFPSSVYMKEKYRINNRLALPFLYTYRSINGLFKSLRWSNSR